MRFVFLCLLLLGNTGCHRYSGFEEASNSEAFWRIGQTVASEVPESNAKDILLDSGILLGKDVIIHGYVEQIQQDGVYAIVRDGAVKMLLSLASLDYLKYRDLNLKVGDEIKIWASVESGKRGLPFLKGVALYRI